MSRVSRPQPALKSLYLVQSETVEDSSELSLNTLHLQSQKTLMDKADERDLFKKVLAFLQKFFKSEAYRQKIEGGLHKQKSASYIGSTKQNQRMVSFKKMNTGSRVCFDGQVKKKEEQVEVGRSRANNKKISIFVVEEDYDSGEEMSENFISETSVKTIRSIDIPHMEMNQENISLIYDSPQPFLVNLSLCLLVRYCLNSKREIVFEDSAWVLSVATIVAYKLYYDEEIEGLMECFMQVMKVSRKDLIDLQRCFFEAIDYNTVISNHDYHFVLTSFLAIPTNSTQ